MLALVDGPNIGDTVAGCVVHLVNCEAWTAIPKQGAWPGGIAITPMPRSDRGPRSEQVRVMVFEPRGAFFVILSVEGRDVYSQAGGLGVRVKGLARTLAQLGYQTYLYFCGDPDLPGEESHDSGRLVYRRWCQWISARHRGGVYDGEEEKIRDWNSSLPPSLIHNVIAPALASGRNVGGMGQEWHTSWSMNLLSESLYYRGLRDRVVILLNPNNTFGIHRINWPALALAATITTVSRYMKFKVWERGINPIVIPNGIPRASSQDAEPAALAHLNSAPPADHSSFTIGPF